MSREDPAAEPEFFGQLLDACLPRFGLTISPSSKEALSLYLAELDRWRARINLTGRLSPRDLAEHTLESVLGSQLIIDGERVVDIGSGAGFPALPLAIVRPDLSISMVEPRGKKAAFLKHACRRMALENTEVIQAEIGQIRERSWDSATTRALGRLANAFHRTRFLKPGGLLLAWTTQADRLQKELSGAFRLEKVLPVPGAERRSIAAFRRL